MNFVTSVFKKYINKNESKQGQGDANTENKTIAESIKQTNKTSELEKSQSAVPESLNEKQKPTFSNDEEECFQDAEVNPTSLYSMETTNNDLYSLSIIDQQDKLPGITANVNDLSNSATGNVELHSSRSDVLSETSNKEENVITISHTSNRSRPDSPNNSMMDSLDIVHLQDELTPQELTDSIEKIQTDRSESLLIPTFNNQNDESEYNSLSEIATNSIENLISLEKLNRNSATNENSVECGKAQSQCEQQHQACKEARISNVTNKPNVDNLVQIKMVSLSDILSDSAIKETSTLDEINSNLKTKSNVVVTYASNDMSAECAKESKSALEVLIQNVNRTFAIDESCSANMPRQFPLNDNGKLYDKTVNDVQKTVGLERKIDGNIETLHAKQKLLPVQQDLDVLKPSIDENEITESKRALKPSRVSDMQKIENQKRKCDVVEESAKKANMEQSPQENPHNEKIIVLETDTVLNEECKENIPNDTCKADAESVSEINTGEDILANNKGNNKELQSAENKGNTYIVGDVKTTVKTTSLAIEQNQDKNDDNGKPLDQKSNKQHGSMDKQRDFKQDENRSENLEDKTEEIIEESMVTNSNSCQGESKESERRVKGKQESEATQNMPASKNVEIEQKPHEIAIKVTQDLQIFDHNQTETTPECQKRLENDSEFNTEQYCEELDETIDKSKTNDSLIINSDSQNPKRPNDLNLEQKLINQDELLVANDIEKALEQNTSIAIDRQDTQEFEILEKQFKEHLGHGREFKPKDNLKCLAPDNTYNKGNSEVELKTNEAETNNSKAITKEETLLKTASLEEISVEKIDTKEIDNLINKWKEADGSSKLQIMTDKNNTKEESADIEITSKPNIKMPEILSLNSSCAGDKPVKLVGNKSENIKEQNLIAEDQQEDADEFKNIENDCNENCILSESGIPDTIHFNQILLEKDQQRPIVSKPRNSTSQRHSADEEKQHNYKDIFERQDTKEFEKLEQQCNIQSDSTAHCTVKGTTEAILDELVEKGHINKEHQELEKSNNETQDSGTHNTMFYRQDTCEFERIERECMENVEERSGILKGENSERLKPNCEDVHAETTDESAVLHEREIEYGNNSDQFKIAEWDTETCNKKDVERTQIFERQDTKEFENLEGQCKAVDDLKLMTDGILAELVAESANETGVKSKESKISLESEQKEVKSQEGNEELITINKIEAIFETVKDDEICLTNIGSLQSKTNTFEEFENLEGQCKAVDDLKLMTDGILAELVAESANETGVKSKESKISLESEQKEVKSQEGNEELITINKIEAIFETVKDDEICLTNIGSLQSKTNTFEEFENLEGQCKAVDDLNLMTDGILEELVAESANETGVKSKESKISLESEQKEVKSQEGNEELITINKIEAIFETVKDDEICLTNIGSLQSKTNTFEEFENLEGQCKAVDDLNLMTDGILAELVAESANETGVKSKESKISLESEQKEVKSQEGNEELITINKIEAIFETIKDDEICLTNIGSHQSKTNTFDESNDEEIGINSPKEDGSKNQTGLQSKRVLKCASELDTEYIQRNSFTQVSTQQRLNSVGENKNRTDITMGPTNEEVSINGIHDNKQKTKQTILVSDEAIQSNLNSTIQKALNDTDDKSSESQKGNENKTFDPPANNRKEDMPIKTEALPNTKNNSTKAKSTSAVAICQDEEATNANNNEISPSLCTSHNDRNENLKNKVNSLQQELDSIRKSNMRNKESRNLKSALEKGVNENVLKYKNLLKEYEAHIVQQTKDLAKLRIESERNVRNFTNTEMAFSDVFEKYEKTKFVIAVYRKNEDILLENIQNAEEQLMRIETKCLSMTQQSLEQIRRAHDQVEQEKRKYKHDIGKLEAQVKRLEIKASSLEIELKQKTDECQALAALCDDITGMNSTRISHDYHREVGAKWSP